jgi:hypothetical protein
MKKPMISLEKLYKVISIIILTVISFAIYDSLINQKWELFFSSLVVLILLLIPLFFEKKIGFKLPIEIEIALAIFIFLSVFMGRAKEFYYKFWWWDIALHSGSAIILGFIGFTIIYLMYSAHKIKAKPITLAVFSLFFAMAIGAIWEVFEFFMDQLFNLQMQDNSLTDTMIDLIVDGIGAIFASTIGFFYFKSTKVPPFQRIINRIRKNNPELFKQ